MLLAILTIYSYVGSTDFILISISEINLEYQKILFFCFFLAFAFKTPALHSGKMHLWVKLSNSGDILKLIVPNYIQNSISGWINHSGQVTNYKINENLMDNRGSKSRIILVKEQRVDGSLCFIKKNI